MDETILDELKEEAAVDLPVVEEMSKVGLFWGHQKSKTHPKMKPYIAATRNGVEIIDLSQTLQALEEATGFIKSKLGDKGIMLLVGTTPQSRATVEELAKKLDFPYVVERWLGGTLTNFKTFSKRIDYFKKLRADREAGKFEKYIKKERLDIDREIKKLTTKFSGIENMQRLPDIVFVANIPHHLTAIREAKRVGVPVVAMVNSDADPRLVDYPIPANDRSRTGIEWILSKLEAAVNEARSQSKITNTPAAEGESASAEESKDG